MKTLFSLASLLVVAGGLSLSAQDAVANIPFDFNVKTKSFKAGTYGIFVDSDRPVIRVRSAVEKGKPVDTALSIVTRVAGETHSTPQDAHIIFDVIGEKRFLSELWLPGKDGFILLVTPEQHTHQVVNVPNKK